MIFKFLVVENASERSMVALSIAPNIIRQSLRVSGTSYFVLQFSVVYSAE